MNLSVLSVNLYFLISYPCISDQDDIIIPNQKDIVYNTSCTNEGSKITGKRRKHHCPYCDILVHNFARHLQRQHSDEFEVQRFIGLEKNNPVRKKIIEKIRKEGDFTSGKYVPVQEKIANPKTANTSCELLPCIHCKGWSKFWNLQLKIILKSINF